MDCSECDCRRVATADTMETRSVADSGSMMYAVGGSNGAWVVRWRHSERADDGTFTTTMSAYTLYGVPIQTWRFSFHADANFLGVSAVIGSRNRLFLWLTPVVYCLDENGVREVGRGDPHSVLFLSSVGDAYLLFGRNFSRVYGPLDSASAETFDVADYYFRGTTEEGTVLLNGPSVISGETYVPPNAAPELYFKDQLLWSREQSRLPPDHEDYDRFAYDDYVIGRDYAFRVIRPRALLYVPGRAGLAAIRDRESRRRDTVAAITAIWGDCGSSCNVSSSAEPTRRGKASLGGFTLGR